MDQSNVTLERMRTFVRVAERGNLSAVAREMNIGQSSVTRHVRELEEALGVALFSRTTRRVTLTEEGSRYYANAVQVLRLVEQAGDEARSKGETAAGTVRISCTAALGVRHVSRLIFTFQDRHPEIAVDLSLTDERIDLVRKGVDVAIRLGPLTDKLHEAAGAWGEPTHPRRLARLSDAAWAADDARGPGEAPWYSHVEHRGQ